MKDFFDKYADDIGKPMEYVSFRRNDVLKLRTDHNTLLQAVTNLLNEIDETSFDGLSYEDWCSDQRLYVLRQITNWTKPEPKVTIGCQPKWWLDKDGKLIENQDYVEPEPEQVDRKGEPKDGTCKFNMFTGMSEAYINGPWVYMAPGDGLVFRRSPRFFDVCTTTKCTKDFAIDHRLGCLPYLIIGHADGYGWFGWLRPNPDMDVTINNTTFTNLKIKEIDDKHFTLDTDIFAGNSYYYIFSEDGFTEVESYIQKTET